MVEQSEPSRIGEPKGAQAASDAEAAPPPLPRCEAVAVSLAMAHVPQEEEACRRVLMAAREAARAAGRRIGPGEGEGADWDQRRYRAEVPHWMLQVPGNRDWTALSHPGARCPPALLKNQAAVGAAWQKPTAVKQVAENAARLAGRRALSQLCE